MVRRSICVGLDFGTTNSIISHMTDDKPAAYLHPFFGRFGVRTAVEEGESTSLKDRIIGIFSPTADVNFKVGLNKWNGERSQKNYRNARRFLEKFLHDFLKSSRASKIDRLVITVPESWIGANEDKLLGGGSQQGARALASICRELKHPSPRIISEPVAATAYLAHRCDHRFSGHVIVYDHGGGTLDISLCWVEGGSVIRLWGIGEDGYRAAAAMNQPVAKRRGFGGVFFDRAMLRHLKAKPDNTHLRDLGQRETDEWLEHFEMQKIGAKDAISQVLSSPTYAARKGTMAFNTKRIGKKIPAVAVSYDDLQQVFDTEMRQDVIDILDLFVAGAEQKAPHLQWSNPDSVRILIVGGFSEFPLVRRLVESYFSRKCQTMSVIESEWRDEERWQAISLGAALVANRAVQVSQTFPFTFGYYVYRGNATPVPVVLIDQNTVIDENQTEQGSDAEEVWREVRDMARGKQRSITFFVQRNGGARVDLPMRTRLSEALPNYREGGPWRVYHEIADGIVSVVFEGRPKGKRGGTNPKKAFQMGDIVELSDGKFREKLASF